MNKTTISYKSKNILIDKLIKQSNIKVLKEKSFLSKFFSIHFLLCFLEILLLQKNYGIIENMLSAI